VTWRGPALDEDQRDVAAMLDDVAGDKADAGLVLDDENAATLVAELRELGVWTLGVAEELGGGGAAPGVTLVALERLGRHWPALGWASVQAHAALEAAGLETPTAVVAADAAHVHLVRDGDRLTGTVDRVDVADPAPALLLVDRDTAHLLEPAALTATPLRRTGLAGACTASLVVDGVARELAVDGAALLGRLRVGAAAVAAGIAGAAVDASTAYAADRHQFGAALTAIPTVRQSLLGQAARLSTLLGAVLAAGADEVSAYAVLREAGDVAIDVCAAALQSHGGYGYLTEYAAERHLRDAVSLRAATAVPSAALAAARSLVGLDPIPTLTQEVS
jgi:alkylation response protein AidB-like acyl-CoA dehydrogenase